MIWTLLIFLITSCSSCKKFAFGRIAGRHRRARARPSREHRVGREARATRPQKLLEEYRQQLAAARHEASEIVEPRAQGGRGADAADAGGAARRARARHRPGAGRRSRPRRARRSTSIKNEVADLTAARHREGRAARRARRGRAAAADRRGARPRSTSRRSRAEIARGPSGCRSRRPGLRQGPVRGRGRGGRGSTPSRRDLSAVRARARRDAELARALVQPGVPDRGARSEIVEPIAAGGDDARAATPSASCVDNGRITALPDLDQLFVERYRAEQRSSRSTLTTAIRSTTPRPRTCAAGSEQSTGQTITLKRRRRPADRRRGRPAHARPLRRRLRAPPARRPAPRTYQGPPPVLETVREDTR